MEVRKRRPKDIADLDDMFLYQDDFQKKLMPYFHEMTYEGKVDVTKEFLLHLVSEVGEVLDAIGKWKSLPHIPEKIRRNQIIEELVDISKFVVNIARTWGFVAEDFIEEFRRKSEVVEQKTNQIWTLRESKKVIAIDLDGVLANHFPHLISYCNKKFGTNIPEEEIYLSPLIGRNNYFSTKHSYIEDGEFLEVPPFKGADEFTRVLKEMGYTIAIVSGRAQRYKRIWADSLEWLKKNHICFDSLHIVNRKGREMARIGINPEVFVEDDLGAAQEIAKSGFKCFLMNKTYNQGDLLSGVERVRDYFEILLRMTNAA